MKSESRSLIGALAQASSLELFHLSVIVERMLSDPARILEVRCRLHLGQPVRFLDPSHPGAEPHLRTARVVAMKDTRVVLRDDASRRDWTLPYAAIEPPAAAEPVETDAMPVRAAPVRPGPDAFRVGDRVSFDDRHLQARVGVVVRIHQQTATLDCDGQRWRVSFGLLRPVLDV